MLDDSYQDSTSLMMAKWLMMASRGQEALRFTFGYCAWLQRETWMALFVSSGKKSHWDTNTEVTTLVFALKELCLQKLFEILKLFKISPLGGHVCWLFFIFLEMEIQWKTQVGIVKFRIFTKSGNTSICCIKPWTIASLGNHYSMVRINQFTFFNRREQSLCMKL